MNFINLVRTVFGFVRVAFIGEFNERMLNLCAKNRVTLWDISKENGMIFANMSVHNFKNIRKVRARSRVKIKIVKKCGLPFTVQKNKYRLGFAAGVLIFFAVLNFLGSFIWQIEVVGNNKVSTQAILNACEQVGIVRGVKRKSVDTKIQKEQLLLKLNNVAWASLNIEGSKLTVNISEIKNTDLDDNTPSNIFAKCDGVIKEITVKAGSANVKVGDAVIKGDMLVSGTLYYPETDFTQYVKSKAEIIADTKHKYSITVNKKITQNIATGEWTNRSVLTFFGINIPLYLGQVKEPYITVRNENYIKFLGGELPIGIITKRFNLCKTSEVYLDSSDAFNRAAERIDEAIKSANYLRYEKTSEEVYETDDSLTLTRWYNCVENICYEENLVLNDLN